VGEGKGNFFIQDRKLINFLRNLRYFLFSSFPKHMVILYLLHHQGDRINPLCHCVILYYSANNFLRLKPYLCNNNTGHLALQRKE